MERLRQIHAAEIAALKEEFMAKPGPSSSNYGDVDCDSVTLARMKTNCEEQSKILGQNHQKEILANRKKSGYVFD